MGKGEFYIGKIPNVWAEKKYFMTAFTSTRLSKIFNWNSCLKNKHLIGIRQKNQEKWELGKKYQF